MPLPANWSAHGRRLQVTAPKSAPISSAPSRRAATLVVANFTTESSGSSVSTIKALTGRMGFALHVALAVRRHLAALGQQLTTDHGSNRHHRQDTVLIVVIRKVASEVVGQGIDTREVG